MGASVASTSSGVGLTDCAALSCASGAKRAACCSTGNVAQGDFPAEEYWPELCTNESLEANPCTNLGPRNEPPKKESTIRWNALPSTDCAYFLQELEELRQLPLAGLSDGPRPAQRFTSGSVYTGQWRGNMRHGLGLQTWPDGASFHGCWRENRVHGTGRFVHADQDEFVGEWQNNTAQGKGVYTHKAGLMEYAGEWLCDKQHGHGEERWQKGAVYFGQFVFGKKHGRGVYDWPDGSRYRGEWEGNAANGFGHYVGKDGREYYGTWKNSSVHGRGKYKWADGRVYVGDYAFDLKDGIGTFTWQDGRKFAGIWRGNRRVKGMLLNRTGKLLKYYDAPMEAAVLAKPMATLPLPEPPLLSREPAAPPRGSRDSAGSESLVASMPTAAKQAMR